jgi:Transposase DDE domain
VIAVEQGRELTEIADEAGAQFFKSSSLKTALDLNWDNPLERQNALSIILNSLDSVEEWLKSQSNCNNFELAQETLDVARVIEAQNVTLDHQGVPILIQGVATDRRISIEDAEMRHGRKSRSKKIDGYKRHILKDLESGLVCAVALTRANTPEAAATVDLGGRTVSIHPDEALMQELRARQSTAMGRTDLRKRTTVEHSLAHIGHWQGNRARYIGQRKNLFDLRRVSVVHNLHVIARMDRVRPITPCIESNSWIG